MHPRARAMAASAREALPGRAFLRLDLGDALFASNAPRFADGDAVSEALRQRGFDARLEGGILRLYPRSIWIEELERLPPRDDLTESLLRFRGLRVEEASMALFILGLKAQSEGEVWAFDKRLRQRAAVAMREGGGGGLYGCGQILADGL